MTDTPTRTAYRDLELAYHFFNAALFENKLPPLLITMQRKNKRIFGYFCPNQFASEDGKTDELAMNPMHFRNRDFRFIVSVLVHEQVHVWQQHYGKPGRGRYHNKEWGDKMKEIGLHPSNTGEPGGKETGDQMMHYVLDDGPFDRSFKRFVSKGHRLTWGDNLVVEADGNGSDEDGDGDAEKKKQTRVKFTCPKCGDNAWGKPTLDLSCNKCSVKLVRADESEPAAEPDSQSEPPAEPVANPAPVAN